MKTLLTCLAIGLIALIIGLLRQPRIAELERLVAPNKASITSKHATAVSDSHSLVPLKRRMSPERKSASDVFNDFINRENVLTQLTSGVGVAIDNKQGFEEMMKLDLAGQRKLIRLVTESDSKAFSDDLYRCEAINLCLCAMADRNPEVALEYLLDHEAKIGKFYANRMPPNAMVHYSLLRLSQEDAQLAATKLAEIAKLHRKAIEGGGSISKIIDTIAERDLDLACETIGHLPENNQVESWLTIISKAETKEQCARTLEAFRKNPMADPAASNGVVIPLFSKAKGQDTPWRDFEGWLGELNLTQSETTRYAPAISKMRQPGEEPEVADWLLSNLSPSKDRDFLLWQTTQGFWESTDPAGAAAFLHEQKIDPEEMSQLGQQQDHRLIPY